MSVLEFENTQGIMLRYSTATVIHRAAAFFIDLIILVIALLLLNAAFASVPESFRIGLILVPIFFFYALLMELLNEGRSLGKMILGLKVVRIDGRPPSGYDFLMRWMFRWVDIYMCMGGFAAMLVAATPRAQRIGDLLADTTVIHTKNLRVPLKRILSLNELSHYKAQYPQAGKLSEKQVLLAKETLHRFLKLKNASHTEALNLVAERLAENFGVDKPKNNHQFVQTVIKDYISLTR